MKWFGLGLDSFLSPKLNSGMRINSCLKNELILIGNYHLNAKLLGFEAIRETYQLKVIFPGSYPNSIPKVFETGGKITRTIDYHTNSDGSLCLGSDLRVLSILKKSADISSFFKFLVDPFLYSVSYKIKHNCFPYGELKHGEQGLIQDYEVMFGVDGKKAVLQVLEILCKRKRVANKKYCPCGCGKRLSRCRYRFELDHWRQIGKRRWFKNHIEKRFEPIQKKPKKKTKNKHKG